MNITMEAGALFDIHSRRKNKAFQLDTTIVNACVSSNLENATRNAREHLADAVEWKTNKYLNSFPASSSLLPLATSTCDEA